MKPLIGSQVRRCERGGPNTDRHHGSQSDTPQDDSTLGKEASQQTASEDYKYNQSFQKVDFLGLMY